MNENEKNLAEQLHEVRGDLIVLHHEYSCSTLALLVLRQAISKVLGPNDNVTGLRRSLDVGKILNDLGAAMVQSALLEEGNLDASESFEASNQVSEPNEQSAV